MVADSHERGPKSGDTLTVYIPYGRNALTSEFVVHTRGNPLNFVGPIRSILGNLDANLPLADVRSFEEIVNLSLSPQKFNTIVLSIFGGLALLLAVAGIYGVLSYSMSRRTAEIGFESRAGSERREYFAPHCPSGHGAGSGRGRVGRGECFGAVALICGAVIWCEAI